MILAEGTSESEVLTSMVDGEKCIKLSVATVERIAKYLLGRQAISRFIVASVLEKIAVDLVQGDSGIQTQEGRILRGKMIQDRKATSYWCRLTVNWKK